jgi:predicted DNA-binding protein (MmcQ/YjbR family)
MKHFDCRTYCLSLPEATEDFPFGPDVAVYRVRGKMFALYSVEKSGLSSVNLKCDQVQALILRDIFPAVTAGYHMNKKHWNTVLLDGSIPHGELERMVDHSYALVVKKLPKVERQFLELRYPPDVLFRG